MTDVGITIEIASARLQVYLAAEARVLQKQSYKIDNRELTYADLGEIRAGVDYWQEWVTRLGGTKPRAVGRVRRGFYRAR